MFSVSVNKSWLVLAVPWESCSLWRLLGWFCPGACESHWVTPSAIPKQWKPLGGDFPLSLLFLSEFLGFYTKRSPKRKSGTLLPLNKRGLGLCLWPRDWGMCQLGIKCPKALSLRCSLGAIPSHAWVLSDWRFMWKDRFNHRSCWVHVGWVSWIIFFTKSVLQAPW